MISPIHVKLLLGLILLLAVGCKTSSETISEKSRSVKTSTTQYEKNVLIIQLKDSYKTTLPEYDKDSPSLGEYPYLGGLLTPYKVSTITSFVPREASSSMKKLYKIQFDESITSKDFMEALKKIEIIQHVEKSPINKTN